MELSLEPISRAEAVTVSALNRRVRVLLEQGISRLWIEGELSNLSRPASGHLYFSLKDDTAQVRAAWFRQRQRGPTHRFKNGDHVVVFGRVSLYEPRGEYQLIVEQIEPTGEGALMREFERLKARLSAEGLFDSARKRPLPSLPRSVGVITSKSGAAISDILTVLKRRFPGARVVLYPAAVQGAGAPRELRAALETAVRRAECDVLIIGRGGGSPEDLHAFNDEALARAIAASPIPTVSAVGHEIDFTIADFVADVRAPTPSGAAELIVPDCLEWIRRFGVLSERIARLARRAVEQRQQAFDWLGRRLMAASPSAGLSRQADRLRELGGRMTAGIRGRLWHAHRGLQSVEARLHRAAPAIAIQRRRARVDSLEQRLGTAARRILGRTGHRFDLVARGLESVSPLATLARGYAVVADAATGRALLDASAAPAGTALRIRLHRGELDATVDEEAQDAS